MADDIILIAPGVGIQNTDSDTLNSTMDLVASGGKLSPAQQQLANVFNPGGVTSFLAGAKVQAPASFVTPPTVKTPAFDINQLLFPGFNMSAQPAQPPRGPGTAFALGDQSLAEDVENLRLQNEKIAQEQKAADLKVRESLNKGVLPGAVTVKNRLGLPLLNLSSQTQSLLSQAQKNQQQLREDMQRNLFGGIERRASVIGQMQRPPIAGLF